VVLGYSRPVDREASPPPDEPEDQGMEGWISEVADAAGDAPGFEVHLPVTPGARGGAGAGWLGFFVSEAGSYIPGSEFRIEQMRDPWCAACCWTGAAPARLPSREVRLLPPVAGGAVERAEVSWPPPRSAAGRRAPEPAPPVDAKVAVRWSVIDGALEFEVSWPAEARAEVADGWTGVFLDPEGRELAEAFAVLRVKDPRRALCRWPAGRSSQLPSHDVRLRPPAPARPRGAASRR
jgi:hypothetical protein